MYFAYLAQTFRLNSSSPNRGDCFIVELMLIWFGVKNSFEPKIVFMHLGKTNSALRVAGLRVLSIARNSFKLEEKFTRVSRRCSIGLTAASPAVQL